MWVLIPDIVKGSGSHIPAFDQMAFRAGINPAPSMWRGLSSFHGCSVERPPFGFSLIENLMVKSAASRDVRPEAGLWRPSIRSEAWMSRQHNPACAWVARFRSAVLSGPIYRTGFIDETKGRPGLAHTDSIVDW